MNAEKNRILFSRAPYGACLFRILIFFRNFIASVIEWVERVGGEKFFKRSFEKKGENYEDNQEQVEQEANEVPQNKDVVHTPKNRQYSTVNSGVVNSVVAFLAEQKQDYWWWRLSTGE